MFRTNETPEQRAISDGKRAASRQRKQDQRARDAEREALRETLQLGAREAQQKIWLANRARLSPDELQKLEARQEEFLGHIFLVEEIINYINEPGRQFGTNLPWPDVIYVDALPFSYASDGVSRLVFHMAPEEFVAMHHEFTVIGHEATQIILPITHDSDKEWFMFGLHTRFLTTVWQKFINVVAAYINAHPGETELDPEIKEKILSEWRKRQPRKRPEVVEYAVNLERISRPPAKPALDRDEENRNAFLQIEGMEF